METKFSPTKPMKTNILKLFICALVMTSFYAARAATVINSSYTGPIGGNWSDPANWSPQIVPNNSADQKFNVSIPGAELPGVTLDIDVKLRSLTLKDNFSTVFLQDHSIVSASTSVGVNFPDEFVTGGVIFISATHAPVLANLGDLADFSGTTLNSGIFLAFAAGDNPAAAATIQFHGADIRTNSGTVQLGTPRGRIVDENGRDALRHLQHNLVDGDLDFEIGHNFTTEGSLINEGAIDLATKDSPAGPGDVNTTLTINGNYTGIGFPLDPNTLGVVGLYAPGPIGDARMVINGALTNYDAGTQTLHKSYFGWFAANGASATTRVLGGGKPLDIVTSKASLVFGGPNTGFRDRFGNDALRNLAVSARLIIGNRNFTTANDFTSTSRLTIFGDTRFVVSGHLTIRSGFFEVSPLSEYVHEGAPDFPTTPYLSSQVIVRGNFNLPAPGILRFHVLDHEKTATVNVKGAAVFAGTLQAGVEDVSKVDADDSFTVLTADKIAGQFSNVANGGRVDVYAMFDDLGNPQGDPVGTFLVSYNKTKVILSDFQPAADAFNPGPAVRAHDDQQPLHSVSFHARARGGARR
jgi:hypothetical protein